MFERIVYSDHGYEPFLHSEPTPKKAAKSSKKSSRVQSVETDSDADYEPPQYSDRRTPRIPHTEPPTPSKSNSHNEPDDEPQSVIDSSLKIVPRVKSPMLRTKSYGIHQDDLPQFIY